MRPCLRLCSVDSVQDDLNDLLADGIVGGGHPLTVDLGPEDHVVVIPARHDTDIGIVSGSLQRVGCVFGLPRMAVRWLRLCRA